MKKQHTYRRVRASARPASEQPLMQSRRHGRHDDRESRDWVVTSRWDSCVGAVAVSQRTNHWSRIAWKWLQQDDKNPVMMYNIREWILFRYVTFKSSHRFVMSYDETYIYRSWTYPVEFASYLYCSNKLYGVVNIDACTNPCLHVLYTNSAAEKKCFDRNIFLGLPLNLEKL